MDEFEREGSGLILGVGECASLLNMVLPFFLIRKRVGVWSLKKLFREDTLQMMEPASDNLRGLVELDEVDGDIVIGGAAAAAAAGSS